MRPDWGVPIPQAMQQHGGSSKSRLARNLEPPEPKQATDKQVATVPTPDEAEPQR
jgi:hypothetical protein